MAVLGIRIWYVKYVLSYFVEGNLTALTAVHNNVLSRFAIYSLLLMGSTFTTTLKCLNSVMRDVGVVKGAVLCDERDNRLFKLLMIISHFLHF